MKPVIFDGDALDHLGDWLIVNRKIALKIFELLKDIDRNSFTGKGKPEPLKHYFTGCWSRRITDEHRLIYRINNKGLTEVLSCKGHYS
jgi:toxin YoeB